jgi:hypothetical protein
MKCRAFLGGVTAAAVAALLASASAAEAAIVTLNLDFTATTSGPIASHSGSFSFSYDDVTFAPMLNSINFFGITGASDADDFFLDFYLPVDVGAFAYATTTSSLSPVTTATLTPRVANPVPEPASWALMIGGFGITGVALRRRRARLT